MADLSTLPSELLQAILASKHLQAEDLARLESTCYALRAANGVVPYRFHSLPEVAARRRCLDEVLFSRLPPSARSLLLARCNGAWKVVLRFLHGLAQAVQCKIATGKYVTLVVNREGQLVYSGRMAGSTSRGPNLVHLPHPVRVAQVSGSCNHVAILSERGQIFTFGGNASGCCGHGVTGDVLQPTLVTALSGHVCKQVQTGEDFTVALTTAGDVYTWGRGWEGLLGHGDTQDRPLPQKIEELGPVAFVSAGEACTLAVTQDGDLYSFGSGAKLCLGHGSPSSEVRPRLVETFHNQGVFIVATAAGEEQAAAIDSSGFVYTWGLGYCGALGHGDELDRAWPEKVLALRQHRAVQVVSRKRKTLVVDDNGQVFSFGWTAFGALGPGDAHISSKQFTPVLMSSLSGHHITHVSTGFYHTAVADRQGKVFVFGDNEKGQLGVVRSTDPWAILDLEDTFAACSVQS